MYVGGVRWPSVSEQATMKKQNKTKSHQKTDLPKICGVVPVGGVRWPSVSDLETMKNTQPNQKRTYQR